MKEKVLILVKTYPAFSKSKGIELVCTAGINERGEWRRIYPVPFRDLSELEQYDKYQWIEVDIEKNSSDVRVESFKLKPETRIQLLGKSVPTSDNWRLRKDVLKQTPVYTKLEEIINEAKVNNALSLCRFKPKEIIELKVEATEREWSPKTLESVELKNSQFALIEGIKREIKLVKKVPYKFSYRFKDDTDKESTLMIEDWEIGQLYWNCLKRANGDEDEACKKVKEKYETFIEKNDITLFLGTIHKHHFTAKNPFIIVGVFYPPKTDQFELEF